MPRVTYFMICLLLIGLLSCGTTDEGGTAPSVNYDSLGISSFSIIDGNGSPINDTNAIPVDTSFLLTFDQSLGNMDSYVNSLTSQIELLDMGGGGGNPITLKVEVTSTPNQIKIAPTTDLSYGTTYQLTVKKDLTIGNYRVTNDITYSVTTEKNFDSSLIVIYNDETISPNGNNIAILLPTGTDVSSVMFTLEVGEGATLQDGNNKDLTLSEIRQYTTNMDFSGNATHNFTVTAQDGTNSATYTVGVLQQQMGSKEIISFAFRETDNPLLKENIAMDIDSNNRAITKTVTNVEGITGLIPTIVHSGSNISPASGVAQDFSTNNIYTVTAIDGTTSNYTVTLTSYYGVTFNANGGLIIGDPTVTEYILYGEKASPPSDPSQEHYGFKGWYNAPSGGNTFNFDTPITTQTTVYAQWTNKQYKVSFETYAGTPIPSVTVNSSNSVNKPATDPTSEHYSSFEGWYVDSSFTTLYDFNRVVSNDLTLYAKYIHKQYQVRFYRGADLLDTILLTSLATISVSDYPVNPNAGGAYRWHSNVSLGGVFNKDFLVVADFDLYAEEVPASFEMIIENRLIPTDLTHYGKMSEEIFSNYTPGATVAVRYVKKSGTGDGSSWANASGDIQAMIDGINDANENKVYVIMVESGTYKPGSSYVMKNHVALVGGFISGSYDRAGETRLDGNNNKVLFNNNGNNLNRTALFYGVVITNGHSGSGTTGAGMWNVNSSPTLINVIFSGNSATYGGGMNNGVSSSPTLINVIFSGNSATYGGGMNNGVSSSPTLINVIFSGNSATYGGGMNNGASSSPTLINVTFSGNTASQDGGGMYNFISSPTLINVTFSGNRASQNGGGMFNNSSFPTLINVTFSGNMVTGTGNGGGMRNINGSSPTLINVTFSANTVTSGGGGGIYHDGDGEPLTLINVILSGNNAGNIYLHNDSARTETVNLYYSRNFGGVNASTTASGIRLENGDTVTYPIAINSKEIITEDPGLGTLANNGGEINTISISSSSPAKDKGVYVRGVKAGNTYPEANLYYSKNNTDWYSDLDLTTQESLPNNADDLTATDARGYGRVGRPDMGAYEVGGTAP